MRYNFDIQIPIEENEVLNSGVKFPMDQSPVIGVTLLPTKFENNIDDIHYNSYKPFLESIRAQYHPTPVRNLSNEPISIQVS